MAASIRTIQSLSSTGGQAWSVARTTTTTAAAAAAVNPGTTHGHLSLYSNPNNTNNNNTDAATTASPGIPTTASPIGTPNPGSALNSTTSPTTSPTISTLALSTGPASTASASVGNAPTTGPATAPFSASRGAINQAQSINSHNQYIYNHHLQLSHNHHLQQQQQQQRRQLQLQSQAHGQAQRNQVQGHRQHQAQHHQQQQQQQQRIPHRYQQQQHNQQHHQRTPSQPQSTQPHQFQPYNQHQQAHQFFNNANTYSGRASQGYNGNINRNMSSLHRAPLHYRSASPPSGASASAGAGSTGSVIQAQAQVSSNPFRVQLPQAQGQGGAQGNRKSPPPVPTNRRRSALPQLPIPLPSQVMQQNAGVSASPPFASSMTANSVIPTTSNSTASSTAKMTTATTKTAIRFDPFADEADALEGVASFSGPPFFANSPYANAHYANANSYNSASNIPYTIQIPAAGTHEIQQYALRSKLTYEPARSSAIGGENRSNGLGGHRLNGPRRSPSPPNPIARPTSPPKTGASIEGAPTPQTSPTRTEMGVNLFDRVSVHASVSGSAPSRSPSPPSSASMSSRSPSPPSPPQSSVASARSTPRPQPTPNLSKLVAGILLNRVYAVGKPMRRHPSLSAGVGEEGYVKSALRWEVGV